MSERSKSDAPGYEIDCRERYAIIRFLRVMSYEEFCAMIDDVVERGISARCLWLMGEYLRFSPAEMSSIAEYARGRNPNASRFAFVTEDDVSFGMTRLYSAHRDTEGFDQRVFRDEAEAVAWLEQPV